MKRQMQTFSRARRDRGRGPQCQGRPRGIREIEFFAQTQQLIAGGRNPELRVRPTLAALDVLRKQLDHLRRAASVGRTRNSGLRPAGDQLLGLRKKLDFADAAEADLDIVALDRDLALPAKRLHLPLHVVDVGEGAKSRCLAPDERRDFHNQRLAGVCVAAQGRALIMAARSRGAPFPLVVMQRRVGRNGHLREDGSGRSRRSTRNT